MKGGYKNVGGENVIFSRLANLATLHISDKRLFAMRKDVYHRCEVFHAFDKSRGASRYSTCSIQVACYSVVKDLGQLNALIT